jgi:hypothetical protein
MENWRRHINEAQGKSLKDYADIFDEMMKDWQAGGAEGFPKKEYEDLFYIKTGRYRRDGRSELKLSPEPLDGNPLKELIGKRVRAMVTGILRMPGPSGQSIPMAGQEATIEGVYIWTQHKSGWEAARGIQATLILRWDEDIINQVPNWSKREGCNLDYGNILLYCIPIKHKNVYGIELI